MRKCETCRPSALPFRSLLVAAGALSLTAAFLPQANAHFCPPGANCNVLEHFNFNSEAAGTLLPLTSVEGNATLTNDTANAFPLGNIRTATAGNVGTPLNAVGADPAGNALDVSGNTTGTLKSYCFDIGSINVSGLAVLSVSFALNSIGNGTQFTTFALNFSTNGGATFTNFSTQPISQGTGYQLYHASLTLPAGTTSVIIQFCFTGSTDDRSPNHTYIDNIEIDSVIPEPTTAGGGLLGVLGLCWHQRRRLIRSVRFRRA